MQVPLPFGWTLNFFHSALLSLPGLIGQPQPWLPGHTTHLPAPFPGLTCRHQPPFPARRHQHHRCDHCTVMSSVPGWPLYLPRPVLPTEVPGHIQSLPSSSGHTALSFWSDEQPSILAALLHCTPPSPQPHSWPSRHMPPGSPSNPTEPASHPVLLLQGPSPHWKCVKP